MDKLTQAELQTLYVNFCSYRDTQCNGAAEMSVQAFHAQFGVGPWKQ